MAFENYIEWQHCFVKAVAADLTIGSCARITVINTSYLPDNPIMSYYQTGVDPADAWEKVKKTIPESAR